MPLAPKAAVTSLAVIFGFAFNSCRISSLLLTPFFCLAMNCTPVKVKESSFAVCRIVLGTVNGRTVETLTYRDLNPWHTSRRHWNTPNFLPEWGLGGQSLLSWQGCRAGRHHDSTSGTRFWSDLGGRT